MNDAAIVRGFQPIGNLCANTPRLVDSQRAARNELRDRWTFDELENEGRDPVRLFESVDLRDIRVVQGGKDLRLSLEPGEALGVTASDAGSTLIAMARFRRVSVAR